MGGQRAAFELVDSGEPPIQAKFYWLQKKSRLNIAGAVHLTPNWEDHDYTRNDRFKVGVDFLLTPDGESLVVALSNRGNLRLLELSRKLSNTQVDVLAKWIGVGRAQAPETLHELLWSSFRLQSVNSDFYGGVSNTFNELLQALVADGRAPESAKLFASRLVGRVIFVWFLRKKHLIDETLSYFDPDDLNPETYYSSRLEQLFFGTLNTPIVDREPVRGVVRDGELTNAIDDRTPYLNGGLFAPQDGDWFGESLPFPVGFFTRFYDHLDRFNFTTDESTPEYEQVAIDPEMLGRVFESLLATQLADSGEQARKAKGSFYTPRELVAYMCRSALRNYLYNRVERADDRLLRSIDELLDRTHQDWAKGGSNSLRDAVPTEYRHELLDWLDQVRVFDPACGSGAFPIGMLQLLMKTYSRLEPRLDAAKTKLQIIENNIFGSDIEPMAVEIARLRAWLSLVVEDRGGHIDPLPNLDFKFVCANSLLPLHEHSGLFSDSTLLPRMQEIRTAYFEARRADDKARLQERYTSLMAEGGEIEDEMRTRQIRTFNPFGAAEPSQFFDVETMFGLDGFDIVLGNPPYIGESGHKGLFTAVKGTSFGRRFYAGKMDYFYFFVHLGLDVLKPRGVLAFITTNYFVTATAARKLRDDLRSRADLLELINFNEMRIFDSASGQHNMITVLEKGHSGRLASVAVVAKSRQGSYDPTAVSGILSRVSMSATYSEMAQDELFDGDRIALASSSNSDVEGVLDRMAASAVSLADHFNVNQGVITGGDHISLANTLLIPGKPAGSGIFVLSGEELRDLELDEYESDIVRPHFKNSDIGRYVLRPETHYLVYADKRRRNLEGRPKLTAHLETFRQLIDKSSSNSPYLHRPRSVDFEGEKILVPYRAMANSFAYSNSSAYGNADTYFISARTHAIPIKALLGLLNSRLYFCWLYSRGKRKGEVLELFQDPLQRLPLPKVTKASAALFGEVEKLVNEIVDALKQDPTSDVAGIEREILGITFDLFDLTEGDRDLILDWTPPRAD